MFSCLHKIRESLLIAGLLAALGSSTSPAQQPIKLRVATITPTGSFFVDKLLVPYLERIKADSAGTLDYQIYPAGTLGRNPSEQMKIVADGIADISFVVPSYTPGQFDDYAISELPGLAQTSLQGSLGVWNVYKAGLLPSVPGIKPLAIFTNAPNVLHFAKPVRSVADLQGMKLRASGRVQTDLLAAFGATPIANLRITEVAEALSRGVAEGTISDWLAIRDFRIERIARSHFQTPLGMVTLMLPINAAVYEKLPPAARAAIDKHSGEAMARAAGQAFDSESAALIEILRGDKERQIIIPDSVAMARLKPRFDAIISAWQDATPKRAAIIKAFEAGVAAAGPKL